MKKSIRLIVIFLIIIVLSIIMIFLLFPRKYNDLISKYSAEYSLSRSMVASVINIESGYDPGSKSHAGAVGLMQLLPSTAFDCADRIGIEIEEYDLYDIETNIKLGCFYLNYLLGIFDDNLINTLCAYNWGLGNVRDWIANGNVDESGTITNVPVEETKNYLGKYKVNCFVYENIYKFG